MGVRGSGRTRSYALVHARVTRTVLLRFGETKEITSAINHSKPYVFCHVRGFRFRSTPMLNGAFRFSYVNNS